MRTTRTLLTAAVAVASLASLAVGAAVAAVPGGNGAVVFQSVNRKGVANPEIWARTPAGQFVNLTNNPASDMYPAVSPDGTKIAFSSSRDGASGIYVMAINGKNVVRLTKDTTPNQDPTWSPDGKQIAFESFRDGHSEIYAMNADGSNVRRLTTSTTSMEPAWSPDGTRIAFTSTRPGRPVGIYTMAPDGSNVQYVTPSVIGNAFPSWSPDSASITFAAANEVFTVPSTGGTAKKLTSFRRAAFASIYSPDGRQIAYQSGENLKDNEIFAMAATAGAVQTNLSNDPADDRNPDWAPTGTLAAVEVGQTCPATLSANPLGTRLQFNFRAATPMSAVDATGLALFDTGLRAAPFTAWTSLWAAGRYAVKCGAGTTTISVPMVARPTKGTVTTTFTVAWSAIKAPAGFVYDVQVKAPGAATFVDWQVGTTAGQAAFTVDQAAPVAGTYAFQARLRRDTGGTSGYSLPVSITVR